MKKQAFILLTSLALLGCEADAGESATTGTETNWLTACETSDECGVGSCVCGLCTFECESTSECDDAPGPARCATAGDPDHGEQCAGSGVAGICLAAEEADDDAPGDDSSEDVTANDATMGDDDPASDDDAMVGADDDLALDDDATVGADDDLALDDDATIDDTMADDDTVGTDDDLALDDVPADDDVNAGGNSTGGTAGEGGISGGNGGGGGTAGSEPCREGCTEVCAGDVCGCACEPDATWAACEAPSDCTLVPSDCCTCFDFDAVHADRLEEHEDAVCPDPQAVECAPCMAGPDPYRTASCIQGVCAVVQLDETPLTECEVNADCALAEPLCCPSCMEITRADDQLIGIDADRAQDLRALLCNPEGGCAGCTTPLPENYEPVCSSGRCIVAAESIATASCPAPDGTDVGVEVHAGPSGNGFDCQSGVLAATLIMSQQELDDFVLQCGQPALGVDPMVAPAVDFDSRFVFAAVGFETTNFAFEYAVETSDGIHVGATRYAYCGGAAPPDSVLLVEMPWTARIVVQDSCFSGTCTGPLPP